MIFPSGYWKERKNLFISLDFSAQLRQGSVLAVVQSYTSTYYTYILKKRYISPERKEANKPSQPPSPIKKAEVDPVSTISMPKADPQGIVNK